eukprot:3399771-Heterocapsa_arctica.AAC.1
MACLKRQIAWETKRKAEELQEKEPPMEKRRRVQEKESPKKRSRDDIENEELSDEMEDEEARSKRGRYPEQEEALAEEEVAARGASRDARLVTAIGQVPPCIDEYTGLVLDEKRVQEGMARENSSLA